MQASDLEAVVVKEGSLFLLCMQDGDIRDASHQGLYFHDMRHLSKQTLRLSGQPTMSLLADPDAGDRAVFELTNADLHGRKCEVRVRKQALGIRREKSLGDGYVETITIRNYMSEPAEFTLELEYAADFADMFAVRGMHPGKRGTLHPPHRSGSHLIFRYDGADGHVRTTQLRFSHAPRTHKRGQLTYPLHLSVCAPI